jgi:uncharacterized protein
VDVVSARRVVFLVVTVLLASASARAQPLPKLTDPVNDFAGVIDPASAGEINARSRALLAASGDTVVVATVDTIAPYGSIEEYAVRLFEQSGIGDKELDRGVLVLLAVSERRIRIEVGYGLEEFITDGFAGETIREQMLPAFRSGEYGPGLLAGVTALVRRISERRGVAVDGLPAAPRNAVEDPPVFQIVLIILVLIAIATIGSTRGGGPGIRRRGRHWHGGLGGFGGGFGGFGGGLGGGFGGGFGGGRGGGFGGFGGGRSGGGGASGGW